MGTQAGTQGKTQTVNLLAQGRVPVNEISLDHDWELYSAHKFLQLDIHWEPAEHKLVHAAPIFLPLFLPAAHLPLPSPSHTLPPSSTMAEIQTSVTTATASTLDAPANAVTLSHPMTTIEPTMALATSSDPLPNILTKVSTSTFATEPQQTPQVDPGPVFGGPSGGSSVRTLVRMHCQQIRKALDLQLNACTCGVTIMDLEIQERQGMMKCHTPGCETVWVCSISLPCLFLKLLMQSL